MKKAKLVKVYVENYVYVAEEDLENFLNRSANELRDYTAYRHPKVELVKRPEAIYYFDKDEKQIYSAVETVMLPEDTKLSSITVTREVKVVIPTTQSEEIK